MVCTIATHSTIDDINKLPINLIDPIMKQYLQFPNNIAIVMITIGTMITTATTTTPVQMIYYYQTFVH